MIVSRILINYCRIRIIFQNIISISSHGYEIVGIYNPPKAKIIDKHCQNMTKTLLSSLNSLQASLIDSKETSCGWLKVTHLSLNTGIGHAVSALNAQLKMVCASYLYLVY